MVTVNILSHYDSSILYSEFFILSAKKQTRNYGLILKSEKAQQSIKNCWSQFIILVYSLSLTVVPPFFK